ncbi:MAG: hypothetical protein Q9167_005214 [Letrouitia subvulpina]
MKVPFSSGDSDASLTAIATQERRVFELKDELQKAENELQRLKKQWALQQATRKRNETRHSEPLQPLRTDYQTLKDKELESDYDSALSPKTTSSSPTKERECQPPRRNSQHSMRPPYRKVFSGSRHTRALSLLSPETSSGKSSFSDHVQQVPGSTKYIANNNGERPYGRIDQSGEHFPTKSPADSQHAARAVSKEPFLETGKQLVDEFRDGLWTLFEDLRQVTIGDEAKTGLDYRARNVTVNGTIAHGDRKGPTDNMINTLEGPTQTMTPKRGTVEKVTSTATSIPYDTHSPRKTSPIRFTPSSKNIKEPKHLIAHCNDSDDEGWDNWDSPAAKTSASQPFSELLYP